MRKLSTFVGLTGFFLAVLVQSLSGCSSGTCDKCDTAGLLEWCTDCGTDTCTETIQDKATGAVKFQCTENIGSTCATSALNMYCNAQ
jgi:hypothetical protein